MTILEEALDIPYEGRAHIPCSIWSASTRPRGVVLLGHGLGVDRFDSTVRVPVEILAEEHHAAVVVPEIPLHGVRAMADDDPAGIVDRWQRFWIGGGMESVAAELDLLTRFCRQRFEYLPIAYFGLSLGTQYGVPFLAQTEGVGSAVLGLFGSQPAPKTPVMNRFAPAVRCPVYFIQKLDDEIHSAESTTHLFSTLGATEKVLDSTSGTHRQTSMQSLRSACTFLVSRAQFVQLGPSRRA